MKSLLEAMVFRVIRKQCCRPDYCHGCNQYIDPECCHCGTEKNHHYYEEHVFVPSGCLCLYSDRRETGIVTNTTLVAKQVDNLRETW